MKKTKVFDNEPPLKAKKIWYIKGVDENGVTRYYSIHKTWVSHQWDRMKYTTRGYAMKVLNKFNRTNHTMTNLGVWASPLKSTGA